MAFEQIKKVVSNLVPKTTSILVPETSQDTIEPAVQQLLFLMNLNKQAQFLLRLKLYRKVLNAK